MKRLLVLLTLLATTGLGLVSQQAAVAGSGSSAGCNNGAPDGYTEVQVVPQPAPVTLGVQYLSSTNYPTSTDPGYRVCYSTSPPGYTGQDTMGGSIDAGWDGWRFLATCYPQGNQSTVVIGCSYADEHLNCTQATPVPVSCHVGANADYVLVDSGQYDDTDVTFTTGPATVCAVICTSAGPSVGRTGVVATGSIQKSTPAGTDQGEGTTVPSLAYCVNGSCQSAPAPVPSSVGVGWNYPEVTRVHPLLCLGIGPSCIPGGATVHNDEYIGAVQVGSTVIPVPSPLPRDACASVWNTVYPGYECP